MTHHQAQGSALSHLHGDHWSIERAEQSRVKAVNGLIIFCHCLQILLINAPSTWIWQHYKKILTLNSYFQVLQNPVQTKVL